MSAAYLERSACPICGAPVTESRRAVRSDPPAESLSPGRHGDFLSGYASTRVFFTYNRCACCSGLYCPVYFSQEQLDSLYAHQQENMAEVPLAAREATQADYAQILDRHALPAGDYLELGPDLGLFAARVADRKAFPAMHLYEPNVDVHSMLRRNLAGHGLHLSARPYAPGSAASGSVSLAAAIHVLDHLLDPGALLQDFRRVLTSGGVVFGVTHNEKSALARLLGRRWPPYTLQHPQLYSPASLRRLMARCGLTVQEVRATVNHFPVTHLARGALQLAGFRGGSLPSWPRPTIRLRLGNIAVVARRVD